jgi:hypothetical protein
VAIAWTWGLYQPSSRTQSHADVLPRLLPSREEFCLLLRPFGSDGEVLVPHTSPRGGRFNGLRTSFTLEQVIARAVREELGQVLYAVVDQTRELAPPGPAYLRAPHHDWRGAVQAMILRAHTIVILVPLDQDLRADFEWELAEIVKARRQARVILVLPPPDQDRDAAGRVRRRAAAVAAALEQSRRLSSVPARDVERIDAGLPPDVLVLRLRRYGPEFRVDPWFAVPGRSTWLQRLWLLPTRAPGTARVGSGTYLDCLRPALAACEDQLAGLSFESRYVG